MKIAISEWEGRIAPLFDVSGTVLLIETEPGADHREKSIGLPMDGPQSKMTFLKEHRVEALICGAISRSVRQLGEAIGLQIHPFVSGETADILSAFRQGQLGHANYSMPGCRHCRRHLGSCIGQNNPE
jgi:predicted Fe-Mo cluster-binding NifX family protein